MRPRWTSNPGASNGARFAFAIGCALLGGLVNGCSLFDTTCGEDERSCLGAFPLGVGGECSRNGDCAEGLACVDGACALTGATPMGEECRLTGECAGDTYCGVDPGCTADLVAGDTCHRCLPAGDAAAGAPCTFPAECARGLVCEPPDLSELVLTTLDALANASGTCVEGGTLEQGEACASTPDCLAGLACLPNMEGDLRCQSIPAEVPAIPTLWEGAECPAVDDDTQRALFDVPRGGEDDGAFYALPFPNDIRRTGSRIDLDAHPRAPDEYGLPFVGRYLDLSSEDLDGFSTNPVIYFRFSHPFQFQSVSGDGVRIVDITPGSPGYDQDASIEWKVTTGRLSNYICPHWLALRRPVGNPLRPKTTYAAIVKTSIKPEDGGNFARGTDFSAMLGSSAPSDSALAKAYAAYAPLRAWIGNTGENAGSILSAAVFTTQDPEAMIRELRAKVDERAAPTVSELTVCKSTATTSPCEDAEGRGACQAASGDFTEIHGRIRLPMFQAGTLPYLTPEDGGAIEVDASGTPIVANELGVCFALSVPTAAAPPGGYPVFVFAHGTGGSFAGQLGSNGFAQEMATGAVPAATLAIDLPMHGERRGDSTEKPDNLFFNFLNPRAGRDNALQGAVDLMSVVKWARAGGLSASESPTGTAIALDATRVAIMGHSQGATHTALMLSYEPGVVAAVLSGVGGHLATSLMTKTSPVDITVALPFALLDPDSEFELAGGSYNPALAVVQGFFDRVDPINFGYRLWQEPTSIAPTGQHVFMTYGVGDTYSPNETQDAYAKAGDLTHVEPVLQTIGLFEDSPPLAGNATVGGVSRTVGLRQYAVGGAEDGHFVATEAGHQGRSDVMRFLEQALTGQSPQIGQ